LWLRFEGRKGRITTLEMMQLLLHQQIPTRTPSIHSWNTLGIQKVPTSPPTFTSCTPTKLAFEVGVARVGGERRRVHVAFWTCMPAFCAGRQCHGVGSVGVVLEAVGHRDLLQLLQV